MRAVFRWDEAPDGRFRVCSQRRALRIGQQGDTVTLYNTTLEDHHALWRRYFDLDRDYCGIQAKRRATLCCAEQRAGARYPPWRRSRFETLISFIISANNNIPRIKGIIARYSARLIGTPIPFEGGTCCVSMRTNACRTFAEDLSPLRAGFRDKYIIDAAQKVASGAVNLATIYDMDYGTAKNELKN